MASSTTAASLSGDLVPFVSQSDVTMVIVRLESTHWTRKTEQGLEMEVGTINFNTVERLHGTQLRSGDVIEVSASRVASPTVRVRNRANYWNALRLNTNDTLILACQPTSVPRVWNAVAARQIPSTSAAEVSAVRNAYEIEEFSGTAPQRLKMLQAALESDQDLLNRYALDYFARHADSQRDSAVELLRTTILSPKTSSEHRLNFALALSGQPYFLRDRKADSVNQLVIGTLATSLVNEPSSSSRPTWARLLSSCVLRQFSTEAQEAAVIRRSLIRSPQAPPAARVTSVLSELVAQSAGEDREIASQLLKAWQSAGQ